jgi:hypothetical protein
MKPDRLVIGNLAPPLSFAIEQFGIEAPRDDGVDDQVVITIEVNSFGNSEELSLSTWKAGSALFRVIWDGPKTKQKANNRP